MSAVAGVEMDSTGRKLASEVAQETDGNPFFVAELLRHLTESGAIVERPDGRRELRILDHGSGPAEQRVRCRFPARGTTRRVLEQTLTVAAVIGRTFDVELLDLLVEWTEDDLLDGLETALKASVLVESADRVGRFRFAHALINRALYDGLGATRRGRLHRRVAEALEQLSSTQRVNGWSRGSSRTQPAPRVARPWSSPITGARPATRSGPWTTSWRPPIGRSGRARGGAGGALQPGARADPEGRRGAPPPAEPEARGRVRAVLAHRRGRGVRPGPRSPRAPDRRRVLA